MKKILILLLFISILSYSQNTPRAFKSGEYLKYKINYGLFHAGFATLELSETTHQGNSLFHVFGKGWSVGMVDVFFPVEDIYESYFDKETTQPLHFIRKMSEGGYRKDKEIFFDFNKNKARTVNNLKNKDTINSIYKGVQDMLSAVYFFRNMDMEEIEIGDIITVDLFFDQELYPIKLIYEGKEVVNTRFGKVKTRVYKPIVQKGRVFKSEESVRMWFSDDLNKIPIKVRANILVGSIKAELHEYKGLVKNLPVIFN